MKKLIGVLLVLALVVGAAFAQAAAEEKQELNQRLRLLPMHSTRYIQTFPSRSCRAVLLIL